MDRALVFPAGTVRHLAADDTGELADMQRLEASGFVLGVVALPPAVEESLYRYNNLPAQLVALYDDLDPFDPDEDVLEEAEEAAATLVSRAVLLDEVVDAVYDAVADLRGPLVVRRPDRRGVTAVDRRQALLAVKEILAGDWRAEAVAARLSLHASVAVDARPLLLHDAEEAVDAELSRRAAEVIGRRVVVSVAGGRVTRVAGG